MCVCVGGWDGGVGGWGVPRCCLRLCGEGAETAVRWPRLCNSSSSSSDDDARPIAPRLNFDVLALLLCFLLSLSSRYCSLEQRTPAAISPLYSTPPPFSHLVRRKVLVLGRLEPLELLGARPLDGSEALALALGDLAEGRVAQGGLCTFDVCMVWGGEQEKETSERRRRRKRRRKKGGIEFVERGAGTRSSSVESSSPTTSQKNPRNRVLSRALVLLFAFRNPR